MEWTKAQLEHFAELRAKGPFTGGRYIKNGLDLSLTEVWERLHKPGFEELTEDCKDFLKARTSWARLDDENIIKELNLELAVERNRIVCPRCKFPRVG